MLFCSVSAFAFSRGNLRPPAIPLCAVCAPDNPAAPTRSVPRALGKQEKLQEEGVGTPDPPLGLDTPPSFRSRKPCRSPSLVSRPPVHHHPPRHHRRLLRRHRFSPNPPLPNTSWVPPRFSFCVAGSGEAPLAFGWRSFAPSSAMLPGCASEIMRARRVRRTRGGGDPCGDPGLTA